MKRTVDAQTLRAVARQGAPTRTETWNSVKTHLNEAADEIERLREAVCACLRVVNSDIQSMEVGAAFADLRGVCEGALRE